MAHVSAALAYPGGVAGLPGMAGAGATGALAAAAAAAAAPSSAALAANKVMRELHVGGLPHGVSGVQLQVRDWGGGGPVLMTILSHKQLVEPRTYVSQEIGQHYLAVTTNNAMKDVSILRVTGLPLQG